ncbi:hypothetical protein BF93_03650 [Brachybacterium phenoliresistens]|uniref:DUF4352 domain-containing protein n=1 Tax=Brachybacterium phenoliresistens TaxID=396014 RepID=Z9JQ25_9MICO|nr:hypothetical protein [Brachybacterium phenoliresistens]EWS80490.1 hypothetical protein BF93_03650 [Brachybacterium phenoliresistens]
MTMSHDPSGTHSPPTTDDAARTGASYAHWLQQEPAPESPVPTLSEHPAPPPAAPRRRAAAWWAAGIAGAMVLVLLAFGGGVITGMVLLRALDAQDGYVEAGMMGIEDDFVDGEVTDAAGGVVAGFGDFDRPAVLGEHRLGWDTPEGGHLQVFVETVTWDAAELVAGADPQNPPAEPGHVYVQADLRLTYRGSVPLDLRDGLWVMAETDYWAADSSEAWAEPAAPLHAVSRLDDGDEVTCSVLFEVPEGVVRDVVFSVEPYWASPLYISRG